MLHLVCEILVRHTDGSYLIMQRDFRKHFGGMWEATAGGSALKGETPLECAIRELREETGIVADNIREVGREPNMGYQTFFVEYLCITDWGKDDVILQEYETVAYKWISKSELMSMKKEELVTKRIQKYIEELRID